MAKDLFYGDDARSRVFSGVQKLAKTVGVTMGPKGSNVIIGKHVGAPTITKDGVSVARELVLSDPVEELGCQLVKEVAGRTADVAGDGTTTATILAYNMFKNGLRLVTSGHSTIDIRKGLEWVTGEVVSHLESLAQDVEDDETLRSIATISANNDELIGDKISEAFSRSGWHGTVAAEAFPGDGISVRHIEGAELNSGYISSGFLSGEDTSECVMSNCRILVYDGVLTHINDNLDLFNELSTKNIPVLIIARDIKQEALATFLKNKSLGRLSVCCIKFPIWKSSQKDWKEDLAALVGTNVFGDTYGTGLSDVSIDSLGYAKTVSVGRWATKIFEPRKDLVYIERKLNMYNNTSTNLIGENERLDMKNRANLLTSSASIISVGYSTELELREKGDRIDDALFATKAAIESGFVPGGGIALLSAANSIVTDELAGNVRSSADAFLDSCKSPFRQICENSGVNDAVVENFIINNGGAQSSFGYNAATDSYGDMIEMGVIDPAKVTITAIKNASSIAILLLTTNAVMSEKKDDESSWQPPAGWRLPSENNLNHKY